VRFARRWRLAGSLLLAANLLPAAEHWIQLTSPHFRMYTTNGRAKAVDALRIFEEARDFFAANSPLTPTSGVPVEIIAFNSEKQYAPYRVNKNSFAYYQRGHKSDYIVMQRLGSTYFPAAIHEYTHLFIEHLDLHLPLWLNEGLADVYSSLQPAGGKLMVGSPPPGRLASLRALGPLDVRVLLNVNRESEYYNQSRAMAQFYAQSWELAHMLSLGKKYREGFSRFLTAISRGESAEQAFAGVYQKTLDEVNADLRGYLAPGNIAIRLFALHLDEKQLKPEIGEPSPLELDLVLADLLSTHPETAEQARMRLTRLASQLPGSPDVQESLAYVAWQQHKLDDAKQYFDQALKNGAKSARMLFNYAGLLHDMHAPPAQIMERLQQAIQLDPDFYDARYDLGMEAVHAGDCKAALSAFAGIKAVSPDHAFPLFSTAAYCYWRLDNPNEARRTGELAARAAATPEETKRIQDFLDQLNRVSPPQ
jgi:tetratricopeptide (TPR) repeat protein